MAQHKATKEVQHETLGESRPAGLRTWIEVSTAAIDHNMVEVKKMLSGKTEIMAVVKSNAYGHGLFEYSSYVIKHGAAWLAVDSIVEALTLREQGITTPILVFGYTLPELLGAASQKNISITVSSSLALEEAIAANVPLKIHIKIDTGLHRQGFLPEEISDLILKLVANKSLTNTKDGLLVEGLYTHFADAKRGEGIDYSKKQRDMFDATIAQFSKAGLNPLTHADASPGLMRFGPMNDAFVRIGAVLYGMWPAIFMKEEFGRTLDLKPALSWKTLITEIKKISKGESVGYNRSETLTRDSMIAVCPIGYWHGYPGALSSKGIVLVNGKPAKVLGRVTMDMITIDVTDIPDVAAKDVVTLIDADQASPASAERVAENCGISVHELLTRLNPKIKRIFV